MSGSVDLVVFKVILGSFSALVSNLIDGIICAKFTSVIHVRTAVIKQSAKVHRPLVSGIEVRIYSVPLNLTLYFKITLHRIFVRSVYRRVRKSC